MVMVHNSRRVAIGANAYLRLVESESDVREASIWYVLLYGVCAGKRNINCDLPPESSGTAKKGERRHLVQKVTTFGPKTSRLVIS